MRELALILPGDVWLTNLTGTARPDVSVDGGASISLRDSVPGPALEMIGCASGQEAVAGFVQALKDIDGVTRVGVQSSALGSAAEGASLRQRQLRLRHLPDPQLHRPVPDRRRLRRRAGGRNFDRRRSGSRAGRRKRNCSVE